MSQPLLFETEELPRHYVPSGKVNVLLLIPLMLVGALIAVVMAFVLLLTEDGFYFYFFTPLIVSLPVMGAIFVIVRWSRCRNRGLAGLVGAVLMFVYYEGYWELSYIDNIVVRGPAAVAAVTRIGGLSGLPGYVVYRCKTSRPVQFGHDNPKNPRPPNVVEIGFNSCFFGLETLMVAVLGIVVGRDYGGRVYSERWKRWTSKREFRWPSETAPRVMAAIERGGWPAIAELPRVSRFVNPRNLDFVVFHVEYLPGMRDEPAYVSLTAPRVGWTQKFVLQRRISQLQLVALARALPDLKIQEPDPEDPRRDSSASQASLERLGLAETRDSIWGGATAPAPADFRDQAVAASRKLMAEIRLVDLRTVAASFCVPTGPDGPQRLRSAGRRLLAVQILLICGLTAGLLAVFISTRLKDQRGQDTAMGTLLIFGGGIPMIMALILLREGDRVWKPFLARQLRNQPDSVLELYAEQRLKSRVLRVEHPPNYHKTKWIGEDIGIALFDPEHRRIVMEGLSHRYLIRGEDVTCFRPLLAQNILSIRINYRIGDVTLSLDVTRANPLARFSGGMFAGGGVKKLVSTLADALGCETRAEAESPPAELA